MTDPSVRDWVDAAPDFDLGDEYVGRSEHEIADDIERQADINAVLRSTEI